MVLKSAWLPGTTGSAEASMNLLVLIGRAILPPACRQYLKGAHRDFVFRRAMKKFLTNPASCAVPGHPVLADLIFGWGNEGWSALDEYLAGCISQALSTKGSILECGSGLSTIMIGAIANKNGRKYWALEHNPEWAERVRSVASKYRLASLTLATVPLKDYGEFSWYDVQLDAMPGDFDLVICDGPPGTTKGGRYGLVPVMRQKLKSGCVIMVDDASRQQERDIAERWRVTLGASQKVAGASKPYIVLTVP
jgi:predicted O-methyltransferase YrrM